MSYYNPEQTAQLKEIGHYLQQQRLSQSLSLEDIAEQTYIRLAVLRSLEEGETRELPERIYVQGFIRRYADLLGVDGEALVNRLNTIPDTAPSDTIAPSHLSKQGVQGNTSTQTLTPPLSSRSSQLSSQRRRGMGWGLPLLLLLATLSGLGGYFFFRRPTPEPVVNVDPSPVVVPSPVVEASPTPIPSPSPVKWDGPPTLAVKITERAWIRVTTDGKTVYEGTLMPGEQQKWQAKSEIRLLVGNAGGVNVSFNQQPFERLGRSGEVKTANFRSETVE